MTQEIISFEEAFERLEQILEKIIAGKAPLEESLSLFEDAEALIRACNIRLDYAGQKIEALIKQRGQLSLDPATQKPRTEPFAKSQKPNFMLNDEPASSSFFSGDAFN